MSSLPAANFSAAKDHDSRPTYYPDESRTPEGYSLLHVHLLNDARGAEGPLMPRDVLRDLLTDPLSRVDFMGYVPLDESGKENVLDLPLPVVLRRQEMWCRVSRLQT